MIENRKRGTSLGEMTFYCTTNIKDLEWEKFTNLCYLKIYELKALGCLFETISAFLIER
ncbi:hypothetical protein BC30048_2865 [Bacillus cereus]|uniref:Uncharacterized protein n=1 Tax=Bacillus thuringiensis subsp. tolworthi TaxID=1442 RepID=A0A9W4EU86_BACTO|nr:hypothetical Protein FORC21_2858 [Bacillus cereus]CGF80658.1 Uncharacterised protein [Streptococcus pneumoniae]BAR83773.1 hypothetical protein KNN_02927 [Bacillus thuringiensis serovar tolworthi]KZD86733.1 hypothetical protein B4120_0491 [Bacillus cereus]CJA09112.1 Uncharacterised protein [Streptococcus pneumoniae]